MEHENPGILVLWKTRSPEFSFCGKPEFSFFGKRESENSRFVDNENPRILVLWNTRIREFSRPALEELAARRRVRLSEKARGAAARPALKKRAARRRVRLSKKARCCWGGGLTDRWRGGGGGVTDRWRPRQRVRLFEKARGAAARPALEKRAARRRVRLSE